MDKVYPMSDKTRAKKQANLGFLEFAFRQLIFPTFLVTTKTDTEYRINCLKKTLKGYVPDAKAVEQDLKQLEARIENLGSLLQLLSRAYGSCPACGQPWLDYPVCGCVDGEFSLTQNQVVMQTTNADGVVCVRVYYSQNWLSNYLRLSVDNTNCGENPLTRILWIKPTEEESRLWQQVRELKNQLQEIKESRNQCKDIYGIYALTFERLGEDKLQAFGGGYHFTLNPNTGAESPKPGETWACRKICNAGNMRSRSNLQIAQCQPLICLDPSESQYKALVEDLKNQIIALQRKRGVMTS